MDEVRYMISEASKKINTKPHTLRYWEDELELSIGRNELGHRFYRDSDIELFKTIGLLKDKGFQLKAVKMLLPDINDVNTLDSQTLDKLKNELNGKVISMIEEKKNQEELDKSCQEITTTDSISDNSNENDEEANNDSNENFNTDGTNIVSSENEHEIEETSKDKIGQFQSIMKHIILSALKENNTELTDEICTNVTDGVIKEMNYLMRLQEQKDEERYKKFDATLREYQKSRMYAAASLDYKNRRKSKFFKKNKVYI